MNNHIEVPVRHYFPPDGQFNQEHVLIEFDKQMQKNLDYIHDLGLRFTAELIAGNMINICLENDDFDYVFELVVNTATWPLKIAEIIKEFDAEEYLKYKEEWEES